MHCAIWWRREEKPREALPWLLSSISEKQGPGSKVQRGHPGTDSPESPSVAIVSLIVVGHALVLIHLIPHTQSTEKGVGFSTRGTALTEDFICREKMWDASLTTHSQHTTKDTAGFQFTTLPRTDGGHSLSPRRCKTTPHNPGPASLRHEQQAQQREPWHHRGILPPQP